MCLTVHSLCVVAAVAMASNTLRASRNLFVHFSLSLSLSFTFNIPEPNHGFVLLDFGRNDATLNSPQHLESSLLIVNNCVNV